MADEKPSATSRRAGRRFWIVIGLAASLVVLALALGLGLGLGLKHHHHSNSSNSNSTASQSLSPQTSSNFVVGSILGQPPQERRYNFTIQVANGAPDGVNKTMLVVNGTYPGPTIEANQGDRLVVNVKNNLPNATSIHWHGLFQNGTNWYDGTSGITECGIPPGESLTYNFTFGDFSGTTWWQCVLSTQYTDGITGALIVHPTAQNPTTLPAYDDEIVIQMADLYHDESQVLLADYLSPFGIAGTQGNEPVPDGGTINGFGQYFASGTGGSYFDFTIERSKTYRLRLVNTGSFASIRFSVDNHPLTLIEADGTLLAPSQVSGVTVAVAQRYSVLLHANQTSSANGTYWMRATVQSDMFTYDQPGQNLDIRGVIRYDGAKTGLPGDAASVDPGPGVSGLSDADGTTALTPLIASPAPDATRAVQMSFSFQSTPDGRFLGFMNSTSWEPLSGTSTLLAVHQDPTGFAPVGVGIGAGDQLLVTEDSIQVLDVRVDNLDDGDHPFHLHGHRPWIMGIGPGRYTGQALNATSPLRRDTILIPAYNWVVLRFVTDNPGLWAFHCHLAWHMAAGLLMQFNSLPSALAKLDVPQDIVAQCTKR
ncbi:multicopper oxidase 2A [Lactarius akahatsu]|uniref:Multicopper oxidase 2A n=1 Tax=Lactarius akahatsu TaxID=416441 RepID=A0AAD4LP77_9AGAM|nr:multicopper oxidase 2A [Lactarius akahatsu]